MKLFVDEDLGKAVPEALRAIEIGTVSYVRLAFREGIRRGKYPDGVKDEDWIPFAGQGSWLVLSCNKAILDAEAQRDMWIQHNVGGVFLTSGQEDRVKVLQLVLRKWDWLETIDRHEVRPFAYLLPLSGRNPRLDPRVRAQP